MVKITTLKSAPILEAVFDVRLELDKTYGFEKLETIYEKVRKDFPIKEVSNKWEAVVQMKPGQDVATQSHGGPNGFWFKNLDNTKIFQARTDGFTFNKLKPYNN